VSTAPLLSVQQLETIFMSAEGPVQAVRGVSFDVRGGETLGLVGESGCGKSVTALSVMGLLPSNGHVVAGSISLNGKELLSASSKELRSVRGRDVAMVFQDSTTSLNPLLTIGRQITETLEAHLGMSLARARSRAVELLEEVGVPEAERRLRQYPHQLSGGLRQRVAVAVALAPNPAVLIADEPTTALDVTVQAQLLELLKREQRDRGMGLILITHDLGVVAGMADRLSVMYAGRIVEQGPTGAVFAEPRHPYTLALLRSVPRIDARPERRLASIPGAPPPLAELPAGCPYRPRCPVAVERCAVDDPALVRANGDDRAVACWAGSDNVPR
jgi:oligopeptide transport system ATP-binding protein